MIRPRIRRDTGIALLLGFAVSVQTLHHGIHPRIIYDAQIDGVVLCAPETNKACIAKVVLTAGKPVRASTRAAESGPRAPPSDQSITILSRRFSVCQRAAS